MIESSMPPQASHWEEVYRRKNSLDVSWYRPHLDVSLALLRQAGVNRHSRVVDVGAGASTLVDDLLAMGVTDITAIDLSAAALDVSKQRLCEKAEAVDWRAGDLLATDFPLARFDVWHDRAVLHFLLTKEDLRRYAGQATHAVAPGGFAVIGGFAPEGPERCSGLPVARRSALDIVHVLKPAFDLIAERREQHRTPRGTIQSFAYALLRRA
jgi:hypothetical protein